MKIDINAPEIKDKIKQELALMLTLADNAEKQKNGGFKDEEDKEMSLTKEEILSAETPVYWFNVNKGKIQQIVEWLSLGVEKRDQNGNILKREDGTPIVQTVIDLSLLSSFVRNVIGYTLYSSNELKEFKKVVFAKISKIEKEDLDIAKIEEELLMLKIQKVLTDKQIEMYEEFLENKLKDFKLPSIGELFESLIDLYPIYMAQQLLIIKIQEENNTH